MYVHFLAGLSYYTALLLFSELPSPQAHTPIYWVTYDKGVDSDGAVLDSAGSLVGSCSFEAATDELPSNGSSSSSGSSSRSRRGLFEGLFAKHEGSAVDVPTPKSLEDTVAWTPVNNNIILLHKST